MDNLSNETLSEKAEGKQKTILIAEDELPNFLLLKEYLSERNLVILHAQNGIEAVESFNKYQLIDLILMDLKMPEMSGQEATRAIREINKKIPIIAVTAYASVDENKAFKEIGFNEIITKPVDEIQFLNIVDEFLYSESTFS